jgi:cytochrome b subunit of formate dehydrogenase
MNMRPAMLNGVARWVAGLAVALIAVGSAAAQETCFSCHPAPGLASRIAQGRRTSPEAEALAFKGDAHLRLRCADCHREAVTVPHPSDMQKPQCRSCHPAIRAHVLDHERPELKGKLPTCVTCHGYHHVLRPTNPDSPVSHRNVPDLCLKCHGGTLASPFGYEQSIHGRAHKRDPDSPAAVCTDCHSAHPTEKSGNLLTLVSHARLPSTCGKCHPDVLEVYRESIHGKAVAAGEAEAAACADCHGNEHNILPPSDPAAQTSPEHVTRTCAKCHANATVIRIRGLPADRVTSYEASYHGAANRWGDVKVANCTSCHGHHDILPAKDPRSSISPANLGKTCGACHPGTDLKYTAGDVHFSKGSLSALVVKWIRIIYFLLIGGTLLALGSYIFLDLLAYLRRKRRGDVARFEEDLHELPAPPASLLVRLTLTERVQHWILMVTFVTLALTGFPLLAPKSGFAHVILTICGGVGWRALIHRIAGVLLCGAGLYHLGYLVLTPRGRQWLRDMFPRKSDVINVWEAVKYLLGFSKQRPQFRRFGFPEKLEYVGVTWGTFIMGLTGVVLAAENYSLRYLPKWAWDGARAVHGLEAILAVSVIALWHMYHVVWKPGMWPMSRAWLTGSITFHQLMDDHPAQYKETMEESGGRLDEAEGAPAEDDA